MQLASIFLHEFNSASTFSVCEWLILDLVEFSYHTDTSIQFRQMTEGEQYSTKIATWISDDAQMF